MRKNTFLIRFIDIGLILLFGFIVISDITIRSQIELPGSDPAPPSDDRLPHFITVQIAGNQRYQLYDPQNEILLAAYENLDLLEDALVQYRNQIQNEGKTVFALIELDDNIQMQSFIEILDLCDKIGIPKNVNEETLRL
mgnify:CR=1 FL=1